MSRALPALALALLLASPALALDSEPLDSGPRVQSSRLSPQAAWGALDAPVELARIELHRALRQCCGVHAAAPDYLQLHGADQAAALELRFELHPKLWFQVGSDLDAELPRLDAVDGDTYFSVGFELLVDERLSIRLEDFQPASAFTGGGTFRKDEDEHPPSYSWDGHQIALGARYRLYERVDVEGAGVLYALSPRQRSGGLGGYASLAFSY